MQRYLVKLRMTLHRFKGWNVQHIPRDQNGKADALANLGSMAEDDKPKSEVVMKLRNSVTEGGQIEVNSISLTCDWRNKYI